MTASSSRSRGCSAEAGCVRAVYRDGYISTIRAVGDRTSSRLPGCTDTSIHSAWGVSVAAREVRPMRAAARGGGWRERSEGPPMPTASVNGAELYYEVRDDGPPLLLIMGMTGDAGHFETLAELLATSSRSSATTGVATGAVPARRGGRRIARGGLQGADGQLIGCPAGTGCPATRALHRGGQGGGVVRRSRRRSVGEGDPAHRGRRSVDRDSERREARDRAYRVRLPGFLVDEEVGLGDVIKRATSAAGVRPCGGCEQRAERLNRAVRFTPRSRS